MTGLRAAFFDLDGTLIDREPLMTEAVARVCRREGLVLTESELHGLVGRAWTGVHLELAIEHRLGWGLEDFMVHVLLEGERLTEAGFPARVLPGAVELVTRLAGRGVPVALVTGSLRREAVVAIAQLGIGGHLAAVLAAEDYPEGKPDPACYRAALGAVGLADDDAVRCVVFEDSVVGVAAGRAAGMRVVGTTGANRPAGHPAHQDLSAADRVVHHLDEVTDELLEAVISGSDPRSGRAAMSTGPG